ncbi:MAG: YhbD family protein [Tuberibacillus sp.]
MENELISKKELLELTGISYGQLYRWKRKDLIPEEWFIRKSTFTGQETFFPKEKILRRIDKIINMKDHLSLDEIADQVSPNPTMTTLETETALKHNIVSKVALDVFNERYGNVTILKFDQLLVVFILDKGLKTGAVSLEEGRLLLKVMDEHYEKVKGKPCELILVRKLGFSTCLISASPNELLFENDTKIVFRNQLTQTIEELKDLIQAIEIKN